MDPDREDRGFYRSLVDRDGVGAGRLTAAPRARAAAGPIDADGDRPRDGDALRQGATPRRRRGGAVVPVRGEGGGRPRWPDRRLRRDPLDLAGAPEPEPRARPGGGSEAEPPEGPPDRSTGEVTFIEPERLGDVVEPAAAAVGPTGSAPASRPAQPGRYRRVATLHDASGVAFDAPTEALVPTVIVHVAGELGARYLAANRSARPPASGSCCRSASRTSGRGRGARPGSARRRNLEERPVAAVVAAHWVALDAVPGTGAAATSVHARLPRDSRRAPWSAWSCPHGTGVRGSYLLVIDVQVPA